MTMHAQVSVGDQVSDRQAWCVDRVSEGQVNVLAIRISMGRRFCGCAVPFGTSRRTGVADWPKRNTGFLN